VERVKRAKLAELLRKDYVQTIIMVAITIAIVIGFWYGLRFTYRTEHPLLAVSSGSMRPTLQVGDLILVQGGLNASEITAAPKPDGDILVFRRSNQLIVHRAINKKKEGDIWYFETRGDNNTSSDGWIPEQNVVGKVVEINPPFWTYNYIFWIITLGMGTAFVAVGVAEKQIKPRKVRHNLRS